MDPVASTQVGCVTVAVGVAASGLMVTVPEPVRSAPMAAQLASDRAVTVYVTTPAMALFGLTVTVTGLLLVVAAAGAVAVEVGLADLVLGNSSSGLVEAPAIGTPTVNIGDRQRGRLRADSVIDVGADADGQRQTPRMKTNQFETKSTLFNNNHLSWTVDMMVYNLYRNKMMMMLKITRIDNV